jgi:hypothetical protein
MDVKFWSSLITYPGLWDLWDIIIIFIIITVIIMIILKLLHQDPVSWLLVEWSMLYFFVLHFVPFVICVCIAPFSRTFSRDMYRAFTKSFPSLMVSNYSSYSFPFIPLFFRSSLSLLSKPVEVFLCVSTLCSSLPGHFVLSVISHFYNVPRPSQMC